MNTWTLAPALLVVGLGASMVSSADASIWWVGELVLLLGLAAVGVVALRARRRTGASVRALSQALRWFAVIAAIALGPVIGTVLFGGSPTTTSVVPVVIAFVGAYSMRSSGVEGVGYVAAVAVVGVALFTVFWGGETSEGFARLIQGSVIGLVVLAVVGIAATITKRR